MRGLILSCMGYQVVIPDAVYHGERSPLNDYSMDAEKEYFWDVIFKNIQEFDIIVGELISKYNANPEKIAVMGNSMGGFTAGRIFSHNKYVKTLIAFNGSCSWENFNNGVEESINNVQSEKFDIIEKKVKNLDPMNFLSLLKNRPILLLHGDCDTIVPIDGQRSFYNKLSPLYEDKEKIKLVEYPKLNHFVTTNMMEY